MINGITGVVMTKADVLDSFKELKVCNAYMVNDMVQEEIPFQMTRVKIDPVYKSFNGWNTDTTGIREAKDLPATIVNYIEYINKYIGAPVQYVSNGPGREQIIQL